MIKRLLAGALALYNGGNGVLMLIDGPGWYARVPGVADTGPYNPHFVADIGAAFIVSALGLAAIAIRPALWPAAAAGAAFLVLHALIHVVGIAGGHSHTAGFETLAVILPAALAAYAATPGKGKLMADLETAVALKAFSAHYDYDVSYLDHMRAVAPDAFAAFWKINDAASHRGALPAEALFVAKLVGALAEDCGPCVQLGVKMAEEAGIAAADIEAALTRNEAAMSDAARAAFRFADALVRHDPSLDEAREAARALWGDRGVVELAMGMQVVRLFPMVKIGLGYGKTCQRVTVAGKPVDVAKEAA